MVEGMVRVGSPPLLPGPHRQPSSTTSRPPRHLASPAAATGELTPAAASRPPPAAPVH